ncbi:sensor histidine kinase [Limobrevibacterium gyesilva]|uniref:ATP-binding protein n=1 Tax=Limobrevibacterium gyesilva TaxID=2991712 RepID=A0AA42CJA6_9PROT|nr:ATP-binding protein [Limobrevibacterium gyesilva]MCW3476690.1 ATP-binding protein [Limobrevibacterium gyesilva]
MTYEAVLISALVVVSGLSIVLAVWLLITRRSLAAAARERGAAVQSEQAAVRRMRVASHDLRAIGMTLHGNSGDLTAVSLPHSASIATAAADVFEMADNLHEYTMQSGAHSVLNDEEIHLAVALDDAVTAVAAAIRPGRRLWRIAPDISATLLRADRRALRHIFRRVLTVAVRNTNHDDWIDVVLQPRGDGLAVVIEDEGRVTLHPEEGDLPAEDSRGIGMRLTLARSLMEAHGGTMEIDVREGMGTRISLVFPRDRVLEAPIDRSRGVTALRPAPAAVAS